jgi:hypothetical protein
MENCFALEMNANILSGAFSILSDVLFSFYPIAVCLSFPLLQIICLLQLNMMNCLTLVAHPGLVGLVNLVEKYSCKSSSFYMCKQLLLPSSYSLLWYGGSIASILALMWIKPSC